MQTTLPPNAESEPSPFTVGGTTTSPPGSGGATVGAAAFGVVIAVLALIFASVAVVFGGDDGSSDAPAGGSGGSATLELSEFALTPAALTVPAGGSLGVTNAGSTAHNLTVTGTDVASSDLAGGDSETLDLSSLEPGEYEMICAIPGHADAGMKGTLTITDAGSAAGAAGLSTSGPADSVAGGAHAGHHMNSEDYQKMSEAMDATIAEYPAETEGTGNQILEPTLRAGGVKEFELTAELTSWEVEPGTKVEAWTYNGTVPGPQIRLDVGDPVRIVLRNELPMATDLHLHGINVDNAMDGVAP